MSIKAAIEALDRATPGPWKLMRAKMPEFDGSDVLVAAEPGQKTGTSGRCLAVITDENHVEPHDIPNATLIAAAPQMAALIKRMEELRKKWAIEVEEGKQNGCDCAGCVAHQIEREKKLAELDEIFKEAGE